MHISFVYQQIAEWREALEGAGGGSFLKVPKMPEVISRDPSVINSSGNFVYHCVNAVEYAWHVYKDNAAGSSASYRSTVVFGNANLELISGTIIPPFSNAIDRYVHLRDRSLFGPRERSRVQSRNLLR